MADAGIVNRNGRSASEAFDQLVATSPTEIRELALARELIFDVLPEAVEVTWPRQGSVGWGIGPRKLSEQFAYFMPCQRHVTLGFYRGGELPDPTGLLGSGGRQVSGKLSMRSIKIARPEDIQIPALRALVEAAVTHIRAAAASS